MTRRNALAIFVVVALVYGAASFATVRGPVPTPIEDIIQCLLMPWRCK